MSLSRPTEQLNWESWQPRDVRLLPGFNAWRAGNLAEAEAYFACYNLQHVNADGLRGHASVLWTQKRFHEALALFTQTLNLEPWNAMHWGNLGLVLRDLQRYSSSLAAMDTAIALDENYEPAWNEKGNVLYDQGRYREALDHYRQALRIFSGRAVVHHNLGMCLLALKFPDEARKSFKQALALEANYTYSQCMLFKLEQRNHLS